MVGLGWFQVVSGWFQVISVPHFSKYGQRQIKTTLGHVHIYETQFKKTQLLTQNKTMVTQISPASPSPNFHSGKISVKKITLFTF